MAQVLQRTLESLIQQWDDINLTDSLAGQMIHCDPTAVEICADCNRKAAEFHVRIKKAIAEEDISDVALDVLLRINEIYELSLELDEPLEF